jgi:hypothetical protein
MPGNDNYTTLLLHGDGVNGAIVDYDVAIGGGEDSPTFINDACLSTVDFKFGVSSYYFPGSSDCVNIANSNDWRFEGGDFTVDFWYKLKSASNAGLMQHFDWNDGDQNGWMIEYQTTRGVEFYLMILGEYVIDLRSNYPHGVDNLWRHCAVVRAGSSFIIFIDGQLRNQTIYAEAMPILSDIPLRLGVAYDSLYYYGYMDEVRISKGIARWTDNFTPLTEQYTGYAEFCRKDITYDHQFAVENIATKTVTKQFIRGNKSPIVRS